MGARDREGPQLSERNTAHDPSHRQGPRDSRRHRRPRAGQGQSGSVIRKAVIRPEALRRITG